MAIDQLSSRERSEHMSRIRSKDTKVELTVRKLVWSIGYRYRLHRSDLPGCPDIVFPGRNKVIFVHGCFWHRHNCFSGLRIPKTRVDFWTRKLEGNRQRDIKNQQRLLDLGWKILVVWECEIRDLPALDAKIRLFMESGD